MIWVGLVLTWVALGVLFQVVKRLRREADQRHDELREQIVLTNQRIDLANRQLALAQRRITALRNRDPDPLSN